MRSSTRTNHLIPAPLPPIAEQVRRRAKSTNVHARAHLLKFRVNTLSSFVINSNMKHRFFMGNVCSKNNGFLIKIACFEFLVVNL